MRAADLSVLDTGPVPVAIRFASRLNKEALAGLPGDELVWTSSGHSPDSFGSSRFCPALPTRGGARRRQLTRRPWLGRDHAR